MASRYTFNSETLVFEEVKKFDNPLFEVGLVSYLPRECQLEENEMLGAQGPYLKEEESDFEEDEDEEEENERIAFDNETQKTLERCIKNRFPMSNAIMEMKSLKMTYNMEYSDCVEASFPVVLSQIAQMEGSSDDAGKRAKNIQTFLSEWKSFIKDFVREDSDQFTLLRCAEIFAAETPSFNSSFHLIVQVLYTLKVLSGDIIQQWSAKAQESLKTVGNEEEEADEIFERVKPPQREKFIKDVIISFH